MKAACGTRVSIFVTLLVLLASTAARASADFLVNAEWLEQHIHDPKLVLLEVRYHPHRYYTVGHIPGAVQVQRFRDLGNNFGHPIMRFPSRDAFQVTLRTWGVNNDSLIVIYDDSMTALASRLYYLLELYGFDMRRVKILNGGTIGWTAFNELSKAPAKRSRGNVSLKPANRKMLIEWTDVYSDVVARRDPGIVLLDARPHDMYSGKVVQHAVRGGHIPGAVNIVSLDGVDGQTQVWKSRDDLAAMYRDIPMDKTVYAHCHDGFRSTLAWLQLKSLGYRDVRVYNGGWGDWGNNLTLPVVEGEKPYDNDFDL
jgi:thiosulfate/3-mercaptopyruvate sulfurtransferase